jgi:hypothetical protein
MKVISVTFPRVGIPDSDAHFLERIGTTVSDIDPDNGIAPLMGSPCRGIIARVQDATDGQDVATAIVGALLTSFDIVAGAADEVDANGTRSELSVSDY